VFLSASALTLLRSLPMTATIAHRAIALARNPGGGDFFFIAGVP
jgi:hypothetical protein